MESLRHSKACVECDFLFQMFILSAKGIIKNIPKLEVYNPTPATSTTLFIKEVIVAFYK